MSKKIKTFEQDFFNKKYNISYTFDEMSKNDKLNFLDSKLKNLENQLKKCQEIPKEENFFKKLKNDIYDKEDKKNKINLKKLGTNKKVKKEIIKIVKDDVKEVVQKLKAPDIIKNSQILVNEIIKDVVEKVPTEIKKNDIPKEVVLSILQEEVKKENLPLEEVKKDNLQLEEVNIHFDDILSKLSDIFNKVSQEVFYKLSLKDLPDILLAKLFNYKIIKSKYNNDILNYESRYKKIQKISERTLEKIKNDIEKIGYNNLTPKQKKEYYNRLYSVYLKMFNFDDKYKNVQVINNYDDAIYYTLLSKDLLYMQTHHSSLQNYMIYYTIKAIERQYYLKNITYDKYLKLKDYVYKNRFISDENKNEFYDFYKNMYKKFEEIKKENLQLEEVKKENLQLEEVKKENLQLEEVKEEDKDEKDKLKQFIKKKLEKIFKENKSEQSQVIDNKFDIVRNTVIDLFNKYPDEKTSNNIRLYLIKTINLFIYYAGTEYMKVLHFSDFSIFNTDRVEKTALNMSKVDFDDVFNPVSKELFYYLDPYDVDYEIKKKFKNSKIMLDRYDTIKNIVESTLNKYYKNFIEIKISTRHIKSASDTKKLNLLYPIYLKMVNLDNAYLKHKIIEYYDNSSYPNDNNIYFCENNFKPLGTDIYDINLILYNIIKMIDYEYYKKKITYDKYLKLKEKIKTKSHNIDKQNLYNDVYKYFFVQIYGEKKCNNRNTFLSSLYI